MIFPKIPLLKPSHILYLYCSIYIYEVQLTVGSKENRNLPSLKGPNLKMGQLSKILRVTTVTLESVKQNFTEMLG